MSIDLEKLILTVGYAGLFAIVFAESGLFFGFFFPGDSPPLFRREESLFFKPKNLLAAKAFYDKHGGKTITLARFMPFIRTFAPIVAGAVGMEYRRFLFFNLVGALVWAIGMPLLGYYLGSALGHVEGIDRYFTLLVLAFFFIPGLPTLLHLWRDNKDKIFSRANALMRGLLRRKPSIE